MYRPRVIPVLLIDGRQAIKTIRFRERIYLGDPVNTVSLFNAFEVDELVVLDIGATIQGRSPDIEVIRDIASEANMPFSVGGGIVNCQQIETLLALGAEKVVLSSAAFADLGFVREAVNRFGSSSITACMDVGRDWLKRPQVVTRSGTEVVQGTPLANATRLQDMGVGEIIVQSVVNDGVRQGYDIGLLGSLSESITVPIVALGGAGSMQHMYDVYKQTHISAVAGGSHFCFKGSGRGVLISYPGADELHMFHGLKIQ